MAMVPIQEAQARLGELIHGLAPGEVLRITEGDRLVVVGERESEGVPVPGRCRGMLTIVSEDVDHLRDGDEYLV